MKLPKKWLCEYVDFNVSDEEFVERMMWRGFELAAIEKELPEVFGVITGRILKLEQHPNADRLKVCQVDLGDKVTQILTNATNVFEGAIVPVAYLGAKIKDMTFSAANIRGVDSYGMFCSGKEFNLTNAEYPNAEDDGILILRDDTPLGEDIAKVLEKDDIIFDFDLTPNRPDCNSIIGLCREAAAALGQTMREPVIKHYGGSGTALARVSVQNPTLCPRYCGRVVTNIKIEPSPLWMQRRLRSVGLRPINNIVDITNYVLVEYGHPMHAFDLSCIADSHIVVRNAEKDELVTTLDEKQHRMDEDMLLIADPQKGVGIAGVMGGLNSEITEKTKDVFFESAVFIGSNIRRTSRKLHQSTDAALRFIKGVEPVNAFLALERAVELVTLLNAGTVVGEVIDVCSANTSERSVLVDVAHINSLLNLNLSGESMLGLLNTIHIRGSVEGEKLRLSIPHYRTDIESGIEADWDIAEEVGRLYGYQNIPAELMTGATFRGSIAPQFRDEDLIKDTLVGLGCLEMYNINFTSPSALNTLKFDKDDERMLAVKLLNPFGEEQSLMRTNLYSGMLDTCVRNVNHKTGHGRFMEVGNVHFDNNLTLPEERRMIGLMFFNENESFFTLKGAIIRLCEAFHIRNLRFVKGGAPLFQPGRKSLVYCGERLIGEFGQVHPDVLDAYGLNTPVYLAELSFEALTGCKPAALAYAPIPRFPLVSRDLAVVVDEGVEAQSLVDVIANTETALLIENVRLFDVYRGAGVKSGMKNLAFSFTLRAEDHTLTEDEIRTAFESIIAELEKNGAPLRK
ncbi:MAG: phenylalanine--tRNA ligase subunit beta [Clostridia bacterium]|nr:phenylalanine--tRNA ligase subunit beta [Clostridia bacterium]